MAAAFRSAHGGHTTSATQADLILHSLTPPEEAPQPSRRTRRAARPDRDRRRDQSTRPGRPLDPYGFVLPVRAEQPAREGVSRRAISKVVQMRFTRAVRCAEPREGNDDAHHVADDGSPVMFAAATIVREPHLVETGHGPQVVDVPVMTLRSHAMPSDSRLQTAGTERTSHVDVEPRAHGHRAQSPDVDSTCPRRREDQRVGSRPRADDRVTQRRLRSFFAITAFRPRPGVLR